MEPFVKHTGVVAPLNRSNVDTDAIIPKQFLRMIERKGFGAHLFHEWRFQDYFGMNENPDFVLNRPEYRHASILLTGENFGCGSSREHAPWALMDFGFKAVIAPSFADIFFNNAINNGLLPVALCSKDISELFRWADKKPGVQLTVDLKRQMVIRPDGNSYPFTLSAFSRQCLLNGLDQIGWTLQHEDKITAHERRIKAEQPWRA